MNNNTAVTYELMRSGETEQTHDEHKNKLKVYDHKEAEHDLDLMKPL